MRPTLLIPVAALAVATTSQATEWRIRKIDSPARVTAIETFNGEPRVIAGGLKYRIDIVGPAASFVFVDMPPKADPPKDALPDGHVVTGKHDIIRAWLAEPTKRYDHGILGDAIEAGSLVIERRDGTRHMVRLKDDAVFEDLEPRLADLDGDGHDEIVVVKTYLKQGSSLAVMGMAKSKISRYCAGAPTARCWIARTLELG